MTRPIAHPASRTTSKRGSVLVVVALTGFAAALLVGVDLALSRPAQEARKPAAGERGAGGAEAPAGKPVDRQPDADPAAIDPPRDADGRRLPLDPVPPPPAAVTDEDIGRSITRGVDALVGQFDPKTRRLRRPRKVRGDAAMEAGLNALCVYAMLQAGRATGDPRLDVRGKFMTGLVDWMKRDRAHQGKYQTYARSLRAAALALAARGIKDRDALEEDVGCLVAGSEGKRGGHGYSTGVRVGSSSFDSTGLDDWIDNSNSQYGLLGAWAGAEVGVRVSDEYWLNAWDHWDRGQQRSGQWGYGGRMPGSLAMTSAGLTSSFVAHEYIELERADRSVGRDPFPGPLNKGLKWWEKGDNAVTLPLREHWGYTLYGVERVGLASGFKYFGTHEWYRELASHVIARQKPDGSWKDLVDTAFAVLFLSHGRHPILMNKLRFDGAWANRPRDASYLSRYAGRNLERALNWQVVDLAADHHWHDLLDSPVLYIASHKPPKFTAQDLEKIRRYVEAGGMVFTHTDGERGEGKAFEQWVGGFAGKLFPKYEYVDVPAEHPVYHSVFKVQGRLKPELRMVSNGARILLLHSPQDLAISWQLREEGLNKPAFELGVNLFVYAAGRRELRNRLDSPYVPPPGVPPTRGRVKVALLQYAGNCDPEPGAWRRFANLFQRRTGTAVDAAPVNWRDLKPGAATVAHLTGTARYDPTEQETAATAAFVKAGGVLLVDDCGGGGAFTRSIRAALAQAFPDAKLTRLPDGHPLLSEGAPGMADLTKPRLRKFAADKLRDEKADVAAVASLEYLRAGGGCAILSELDLTSSLLGTQTRGIFGYEPAYAEQLLQNVIFWTIDGAAEGK